MFYSNVIILRTEIDLRYIGNNIEIEPIDVLIDTTFLELLNMIYGIIGVDRHNQLLLIKTKGIPFLHVIEL